MHKPTIFYTTGSEYDFDEDDLDSSLGTMDSEVESKASITAEELWKNQLVLRLESSSLVRSILIQSGIL